LRSRPNLRFVFCASLRVILALRGKTDEDTQVALVLNPRGSDSPNPLRSLKGRDLATHDPGSDVTGQPPGSLFRLWYVDTQFIQGG
jgi:hypothetical protein